jgi:cytochrome c oxidase subunit II
VTPRGQGRSQSLSQGRFGHRSGRVRGLSRRLRPLALVATLGVLAFTLSGCSWVEAVALGWPEGITPQAHVNRQLWIGSVIAAAVIGVIVYGLIFWSSAFHRKKKDDTDFPRQFGYNMPLELVLTVVPFLIVAVLFYFTVVVQEKLQHLEKDPEVVIDITAFQWNWKFGYQRVAFKDGRFNYQGADDAKKKAMTSKPEGKDRHGEELVGPIHGENIEDRSYLNYDKVEILGTSTEIPVLVLPAHKRIEFIQASADVVHTWWVPEFLFKRDVIPHPKENNSLNVWQVEEITRTGAFVGHCAEFCGTYHAMMNFEVRVVEPNDFVAFLQQRMAGKTNAEALQAINQPPLAQTTHPFETRRGELAPSPRG